MTITEELQAMCEAANSVAESSLEPQKTVINELVTAIQEIVQTVERDGLASKAVNYEEMLRQGIKIPVNKLIEFLRAAMFQAALKEAA